MNTQPTNSPLTLEKFIASVVKNQYRKFGMEKWNDSTIPQRFVLMSQKQTSLYDRLLRDRIFKIEKMKDWIDGTFRLEKDGNGIPHLLHKSGMFFTFTRSIKEKSFCIADVKNKKSIWMKNFGQSWLTVKLYKKQLA